MSFAPGVRLGRYEIRSRIGAGGMGDVYLAQDTTLDRKVALKILPSELAANQDRMRRFVQEAKAAAALNHPNIAHIYEIGEANGVHFIAMEYIDGQTLRKYIHRRQVDLGRLLGYMQHVAEALAKAHAAGIVHRDVKPDNIMITRDGHAKILDFGLAKLIEPQEPTSLTSGDVSEIDTEIMQHSTPGILLGTVGYMSPEQARGKSDQIDHRSDIFLFGCTLFEAVTGQRAFEGKDGIETLNKIIREPAPPISEFRPDAPNHLQRILRLCLAKDPEDRYQTIKDVGIELRELRRELEGAGFVTAALSSTDTGLRSTIATASGSGSLGSAGSLHPFSTRASSAEYIVTSIKQHKLGAAAALLVVIGVVVGLYLYSRKPVLDSIAVLPFVNTTGDANTEYLSDGIPEALINSLSRLQQLRVTARSTAFRYKDKEHDPQAIGRELNVRAVLMGRVRQVGDALNVQVDLVDTKTGSQLWGMEYERRTSDVLSVKQEIAREITEKLRLRLTGEEQKELASHDTSNPEAYQFYLLGRFYWNKRTADGLRKATEEFQQAADKDPNYALAYVGLADCYVLLEEYAGAPASDTYPKAKAYAERALQIDSSLAEAHATLGLINDALWKWDDAENEFRKSLELNPNYATAHQWYSVHLRRLKRFDESLAEIKRAQDLDPLSNVINNNVAVVYRVRGDLNSAIETSRKIIELNPTYAGAHESLGLSYLKQQRYAEAIAELQKAAELSKRAGGNLASLGLAYGLAGKRDQALEILGELKGKYARRETDETNIATVYAGLGDKDQAFAWLEKAFQVKNGQLAGVSYAQEYETLRTDSRYADLMQRMGLKP
jgi:serine/threonine protein kinase/tetratricopeptide (TPR) repeat protein